MKKIISTVVIVSLLTTGLFVRPFVFAQTASDAIAQAEIDAKADVNKTLWFIAGFFGGVLGLILSYVLPPSPPATRLVGKSPEYIAAYTDHYKRVAQKEQFNTALTGCGVCAVLYVVYYVFVLSLVYSGGGTTYVPATP